MCKLSGSPGGVIVHFEKNGIHVRGQVCAVRVLMKNAFGCSS